MIACYCRVSSRSQKTDSQKAELTRWLIHQGLDLTAVQWFEDVERGQSLRRPAFARLQRAIGAGTITTVVVWKLDRLARRQQDGINLLTEWCRHNVRVAAVTQQIDLSGPVGRLLARQGLHYLTPVRAQPRSRTAEEWTLQALAQALEMPVETLYGWIRRGRVTARQDTGVAPPRWLIRANAAELARLRALRQAPQIWQRPAAVPPAG